MFGHIYRNVLGFRVFFCLKMQVLDIGEKYQRLAGVSLDKRKKGRLRMLELGAVHYTNLGAHDKTKILYSHKFNISIHDSCLDCNLCMDLMGIMCFLGFVF